MGSIVRKLVNAKLGLKVNRIRTFSSIQMFFTALICVFGDSKLKTEGQTISFPEAAILLVSDGDRDLWPDGILSPQITDFRLHCAESRANPKLPKTAMLWVISTFVVMPLFQQPILYNILKVSQVSPVYKNGDVTDPGNYRPISTLSPFSKVFERLIYKKILFCFNIQFSFFACEQLLFLPICLQYVL